MGCMGTRPQGTLYKLDSRLISTSTVAWSRSQQVRLPKLTHVAESEWSTGRTREDCPKAEIGDIRKIPGTTGSRG